MDWLRYYLDLIGRMPGGVGLPVSQSPYARQQSAGDALIPSLPYEVEEGPDYRQRPATSLYPPESRYRGVGEDLSQGDYVIGSNINPQIGSKDIQRPIWTGPPPARFNYPVSPWTNPFITPEYGIQSSPTNPIIDDRPPEIPPGYSETRGEHSRWRPGRARGGRPHMGLTDGPLRPVGRPLWLGY